MSIFKRTKKEVTPKTTVPAGEKKVGTVSKASGLSWVLVSPRITEKATGFTTGAPVYAFNVAVRANKTQIAHAVKELYKVTPVRVRVVTLPSKVTRNRRGQFGKTSSGKKAYVFLKAGDTIVFA